MRSPSLFWRTLLLVLLLIVASLTAWLQSYRVLERVPRAQTIAQQVTSVVNITRAALLYADPFVRSDLLAELAANEGVRIYPLEPDDKVTPLPDGALIKLIEQAIVAKLGANTRLASEVNGIPGLWVSLSIADDDYWVFIERDPVARTYGTQWIGWAAVALHAVDHRRDFDYSIDQSAAGAVVARECRIGKRSRPRPASRNRPDRDSHGQREL